MEVLPADEVHVWWAPLPETEARESWELLSEAERERARRFRFPRHRRAFVASHAMVRTTLSRYAAVSPAAWEFVAERRGRPRVAGPAGAARPRFNLSHSDALAACAVAAELDVGVDVEGAARVRHALEIAERYFTRGEAEALRDLEGAARVARFLDLWTLKEAYVKARGDGLALPLDGMGFAPGADRVAVAFQPGLRDEPGHWQFALEEPVTGQRLALAVHRPGRPDVAVRLRRAGPLAG